MSDEHDSWFKDLRCRSGSSGAGHQGRGLGRIDHIDKNPFGVEVQVRKIITDSLKHVVYSMS